MTLAQIIEAVDSGEKVHCMTDAYTVINGGVAGYLIKCTLNDYCTGLTDTDGLMREAEGTFYIEQEAI